MKNTTKFINSKIKHVKHSFTGGNITKFSGINIIAKFMNRQKILQNLSRLFPTVFYNSTKFSTVQILMSIIFSSLAGINRMSRIANFTQDPLVKVNLRLNKAINENAISGKLKQLGQKGARMLQDFLLSHKSKQLKKRNT